MDDTNILYGTVGYRHCSVGYELLPPDYCDSKKEGAKAAAGGSGWRMDDSFF
jgi:hypothetical protein